MSSATDFKVEVQPRIADISSEAWDACANPDPDRFDPFVTHAFLKALEDAGTVGGRTGWTPRHLLLKQTGAETVMACAPCYAKTHSQGEYVFDHAWADAFARAGGDYYPKLQIAVPFTPVPGRRLLTTTPALAPALIAAAERIVANNGLSSAHATFIDPAEIPLFESAGWLIRIEMDTEKELANLMRAPDYKKLISEAK